MAQQLFLNDLIDENMDGANPYTSFFLDSIGKGDGSYYSGIGQVYQASPRYRKGYGYLGQYYNPPSFRHGGTGIGSALMSMFRFAMPMIKKGVRKLGTEAVDVASKIATDVIQGKDVKESAQKHVSEKASEVLRQVPEAISGILNKNLQKSDTSVSLPTSRLKRKRVFGSKVKKGFGIKRLKQFPALALMN
jgi:hypothetical protein